MIWEVVHSCDINVLAQSVQLNALLVVYIDMLFLGDGKVGMIVEVAVL